MSASNLLNYPKNKKGNVECHCDVCDDIIFCFFGGWCGVSLARATGLVTLTVKPICNGLLPAQTTDTHTQGVHLCVCIFVGTCMRF